MKKKIFLQSIYLIIFKYPYNIFKIRIFQTIENNLYLYRGRIWTEAADNYNEACQLCHATSSVLLTAFQSKIILLPIFPEWRVRVQTVKRFWQWKIVMDIQIEHCKSDSLTCVSRMICSICWYVIQKFRSRCK